MNQTLTIGRRLAPSCLLVLFLGCASPHPLPRLQSGERYQPQAREGMTVQAVSSEMTKFLLRQQGEVFLRRASDPLAAGSYFIPNHCVVDEDRLLLGYGKDPIWTLRFETLIGEDITVQAGTGAEAGRFIIKVPGSPWSFVATGRDAGQRFADDLLFMQRRAARAQAGAQDSAAEFEARAAQYRQAAVKPPVTEAQRRYIVQANALNQIKDYQGALDLYQKALEVDPVAYPACYFNMALLAVEQGRYRTAITLMKKYLLLVPEAKDARAAQDKIYEWEVMMRKG